MQKVSVFRMEYNIGAGLQVYRDVFRIFGGNLRLIFRDEFSDTDLNFPFFSFHILFVTKYMRNVWEGAIFISIFFFFIHQYTFCMDQNIYYFNLYFVCFCFLQLLKEKTNYEEFQGYAAHVVLFISMSFNKIAKGANHTNYKYYSKNLIKFELIVCIVVYCIFENFLYFLWQIYFSVLWVIG